MRYKMPRMERWMMTRITQRAGWGMRESEPITHGDTSTIYYADARSLRGGSAGGGPRPLGTVDGGGLGGCDGVGVSDALDDDGEETSSSLRSSGFDSF